MRRRGTFLRMTQLRSADYTCAQSARRNATSTKKKTTSNTGAMFYLLPLSGSPR